MHTCTYLYTHRYQNCYDRLTIQHVIRQQTDWWNLGLSWWNTSCICIAYTCICIAYTLHTHLAHLQVNTYCGLCEMNALCMSVIYRFYGPMAMVSTTLSKRSPPSLPWNSWAWKSKEAGAAGNSIVSHQHHPTLLASHPTYSHKSTFLYRGGKRREFRVCFLWIPKPFLAAKVVGATGEPAASRLYRGDCYRY